MNLDLALMDRAFDELHIHGLVEISMIVTAYILLPLHTYYCANYRHFQLLELVANFSSDDHKNSAKNSSGAFGCPLLIFTISVCQCV